MATRQRVPEGPAPDPAVQKIRLRYARRGRLRFSSARDFQRALERAVRRAGVPVAYTAGFHPHPKISYANTAPTGVATEAEFFEISLTREVEPAALMAALNASLPDELPVVEAVVAADGALADRLEASEWRLELPVSKAAPDAVADAVEAFLGRTELTLSRMTKTGEKQVDVRGAVVSLTAHGDGATTVLEGVVRHTIPSVRPGDIVRALVECGLPDPGVEPLATRVTQGPLTADGSVGDALVAGRA